MIHNGNERVAYLLIIVWFVAPSSPVLGGLNIARLIYEFSLIDTTLFYLRVICPSSSAAHRNKNARLITAFRCHASLEIKENKTIKEQVSKLRLEPLLEFLQELNRVLQTSENCPPFSPPGRPSAQPKFPQFVNGDAA